MKIKIPRLSTSNAISFCQSLPLSETADIYYFDVSEVNNYEPLPMLLTAAAIRQFCTERGLNPTDIQLRFTDNDDYRYAELLAQKTDRELLKEKKHDEEELQKATVRSDTVCRLYEKLYEDNATGKVSDEWFMQLSHKYETERLELKTKIKTLRQKLSECGQREQERENFTSAIRRFMRMDRLTAPLLRELIDHIDVFETEGKGKSRTQRIVIYYRFVGYVEIPEVSHRPNIVADTRKGVAVEYLIEPKTA